MRADKLWATIIDEARAAAERDAALAAMLSRAVLDKANLAEALIHQIGARIDPEFENVAEVALANDPAILQDAADDLVSIVSRDPASPGCLPVLLHFKGYLAVQAWRIAHWMWGRGRFDSALMLQSAAASRLDINIHPSAKIGASVFLDHGTGIVIGPFSWIGDGATIMQGVTVGRVSAGEHDAPVIGVGVLISSGASVLGAVTIGDFVKIGAGALVDRDVPDGCTAVGSPMRLVNCPDDRFAA